MSSFFSVIVRRNGAVLWRFVTLIDIIGRRLSWITRPEPPKCTSTRINYFFLQLIIDDPEIVGDHWLVVVWLELANLDLLFQTMEKTRTET